MVTEQILYAFGWAPWSSIIAGTVTALALSVILAVLGVALGFTVVAPKSDDPLSGLGIAFGAWGGFSVIVCTAAGGFVAGLLAGQRGVEIGFLTWAVTTLGAMCFSGLAIGVAVKMIGSAVWNVGSGAASIASSISKNMADTTSYLLSELKDSIHFDVDTEKLNESILGVLRDTGIQTLQPEYLRDQIREVRSGFSTLLRQIALNPAGTQEALGGFLGTLRSRLEALTDEIDRDAAVDALVNARDIPREEAGTMVDNAIAAYDKALEKARETLAEAGDQIEDAKAQLRHLTDQAREKADSLASMAARAALGAALALILAAGISMGSGYCGVKYASSWVAVAGQVQNTTLVR